MKKKAAGGMMMAPKSAVMPVMAGKAKKPMVKPAMPFKKGGKAKKGC